MATKLFVNLPVKDLNRSKAFFTELGLAFFGQAEDMASVIISEHTQVMLLTDTVFASYARNGVVDAAVGTEAILVLGVETRDQVDQLADRAEAAGGSPVGAPRDDGYRYQRGFTDLDGHHWEALCLIDPAGWPAICLPRCSARRVAAGSAPRLGLVRPKRACQVMPGAGTQGGERR